MKEGQKVVIAPTNMASDEFKEKVEGIGEVILTILCRSSIGVCNLLLPEGIIIEGHSHPFVEGPYKGRHYLDIHESHLKAVS